MSSDAGNTKQRRAKRWPQARSLLRSLKPIACAVAVGLLFLLLPLAIPSFTTEAAWQERAVKLSGVLLQLSGLGSVVLGLSRAREMFGERGLWRWLRHLGRQLVRIALPPRIVQRSFEANVNAGSLKLSGHAASVATGSKTLDERVAELEREVGQTRKELKETKRDLAGARQELTRAFQAEAQARQKEDAALNTRMKEAVIGGIHMEAAGVAYIAIGIILTTFPHPIALLLY